MNIFAIGDIHGCLNELTSLHKNILTHNKFDVKNDLLNIEIDQNTIAIVDTVKKTLAAQKSR